MFNKIFTNIVVIDSTIEILGTTGMFTALVGFVAGRFTAGIVTARFTGSLVG